MYCFFYWKISLQKDFRINRDSLEWETKIEHRGKKNQILKNIGSY